MKLALLCFGCEDCAEESPTHSRWAKTRRAAREAGWYFVRVAGEEERHYCPKHNPRHRPETR